MPSALLLSEPTPGHHTHPLLLKELYTVVLVWRQLPLLQGRVGRWEDGEEREVSVNGSYIVIQTYRLNQQLNTEKGSSIATHVDKALNRGCNVCVQL